MQPNLVASVKRRIDFDEWAGRNTLGQELLVTGYVTPRQLMPEWRIVRHVARPVPGVRMFDRLVWTHHDEPDASILEDNFEFRSREEAHEYLVQVLAHVESPRVYFDPRAPFGDVSFRADQDSMFVSARANLVLVVRNAGRLLVPVTPLGASRDTLLTEEPPAPKRRRNSLAATAELRTSLAQPVGISGAAAPAGRSRSVEDGSWTKVFATSGRLYTDEDEIRFRATDPGAARITSYTMSNSAVSGQETVEVFAEA